MTFDVVCEVWTSCCRPCGEVSRFTIIDSLNSNGDMIWMLKRKLLWSFDQCSLVAIISYNCDFSFFGKKINDCKEELSFSENETSLLNAMKKKISVSLKLKIRAEQDDDGERTRMMQRFFLRSPYTMIPCVMRKLSWYGWIYSWWSMMWGRSSLPCWMIISY